MDIKFRKTGGFTVIELLIVIIIISLVASIGSNTYQNQRRQVRYNDSIVKIVSMIKQARNYAVTSRAVFDESLVDDPQTNQDERSYVPEEGYGVYIERSDNIGESRIILFANTQAETDEEKEQFDEGDDIIEEIFMPGIDTEFIGLSLDQALPVHTPISANGGDTDTEAVIIYRPPLADVSMAVNDNPLPGQLAPLDDLYMEFRRAGAAAEVPSKYIHINRVAGFPEVVGPPPE